MCVCRVGRHAGTASPRRVHRWLENHGVLRAKRDAMCRFSGPTTEGVWPRTEVRLRESATNSDGPPCPRTRTWGRREGAVPWTLGPQGRRARRCPADGEGVARVPAAERSTTWRSTRDAAMQELALTLTSALRRRRRCAPPCAGGRHTVRGIGGRRRDGRDGQGVTGSHRPERPAIPAPGHQQRAAHVPTAARIGVRATAKAAVIAE